MISYALLGILAGLALALALVVMKIPRHDRDWQAHLSITPLAEREDGAWTVSPIRDWRYSTEAPVSQDWNVSARIDPEALEEVYLVVEPHPGLPVMAHTLVLFRFESGELIGLTIEARKEVHESYSPVRGALNRFELIYVWATPQDLLTRRAVMLGHDIEIYPLDLTDAQARAFLESVLTRTAAIHERPRFYNTLWSNCTNELAKAAGLAWDPAFILTGGAAKALHRRAVITGETFGDARAAAVQTAWLREHGGLSEAEFNAALVQTLNTAFTRPVNSR